MSFLQPIYRAVVPAVAPQREVSLLEDKKGRGWVWSQYMEQRPFWVPREME